LDINKKNGNTRIGLLQLVVASFLVETFALKAFGIGGVADGREMGAWLESRWQR
jgi:hypothetical protein